MGSKYKLWEMSWEEARDAFKRSDTVIVPTGTLHAHGPSPVSIDASSVENIAHELGRRSGMLTLPLVAYGEDDKMAKYPGSIGISPGTLEAYYTDICRSLRAHGIRKVIFLNGHGGNRESLIRTGNTARGFGMLIAILEWWVIGTQLMKDLFPRDRVYMEELAVAAAIFGKDLPAVRPGPYKGEWGVNPTRPLFGSEIKPYRFNDFEFKGAKVIIPIDAWDIDLEGEPPVVKADMENLEKIGHQIIDRTSDYVVQFAKEFEKVDVDKTLFKA